MISVQERLRIANEFMAKRNNIDPTNKKNIQLKANIAYSNKYHIRLEDVAEHRRRAAIVEEQALAQYTLEDCEDMLGRPLRNSTSISDGHKAVQNPITGESWPTIRALAKHINEGHDKVRYRIVRKRPIQGVFYEFVV